MSTSLSAFGDNARTREEDNKNNFYNVLQPSLSLSTQYPHCHQDKLRKQLKQPLQQVTTPGHCLFEALANQGLLVAKQHFTTLRLAHNLTHFLHSIVRLAMCPREAIPFHGTLSRHGIT